MTHHKADAIFIALGANLEHPILGGPKETCEAALAALGEHGITVLARSRWYRTRPVPVSDQPWFVNGVAQVETDLDAARLMAVLHGIEADFGRVRGVPNAARTLDLDLIDFRGLAADGGKGPVLPHPRMAERAFVLLPLADIAPDWRHPVSGRSLRDLIAALPADHKPEAGGILAEA